MKMQRYSIEEAEALAKRDKRRLIALTFAALLVGGAYFLAPGAGDDDAVARLGIPLPEAVPETPIEPLVFEDTALLAKVRDTSENDRLTLGDEAFLPAFRHARLHTPKHFEQLQIRELTAAVAQEVAEASAEHRLAPLRARGEVVDVEMRRREGGTRDDYLLSLRGPEGATAHALVANVPAGEDGKESVSVGDYVRVDGLYFKQYRADVAGQLVTAPLLLGHRAIASVPPVDEATAREAPALANVRDDEVGSVHELDQEALWQLMARAKLLAAETDWDAARVVDQATLHLIFTDGDTFRGAPFKFPLSRNMGTATVSAPENPLGLDRVSKGWIGNVMWRAPVGVVQWIGPFQNKELAEWDDPQGAQFVEARGWFLRNEVYTKLGGEPGRAPLFVLADVEPFIPPADTMTAYILWFVFGLTALVVAVIFFLLRADKKRSAELQEALVRRRRARRERGGTVDAGSTAPQT
jgi:hypothetical protein